jgi:ABC-type uncharacterized transport system ATPase subunit
MKVRRLLRYYGQPKGKPLKEIDIEINRWIDQIGSPNGSTTHRSPFKGMAQKVSSFRRWSRDQSC